jgi:hypothetical protein
VIAAALLMAVNAGADCAAARALQPANVSPDALLRLANDYAPILLYPADEPNLPASVDDYVATAELWFYSEYCRTPQVKAGKLMDALGTGLALASCRAPGETIAVTGVRSTNKRSTFYLGDIPAGERRGSADTKQWVTYCHAYANDLGGVTLQYWRFYRYNTGLFFGFHIESTSHGGDWEAIHVVLGSDFKPVEIRLLGHTQIATKPWRDVITENGHPIITCEKGSHTSHLATKTDVRDRRRYIEQSSWTGGAVRWPNGAVTPSGPVVMLGQKSCPAPGMEWLRYSGLWGVREASGVFSYYRSGYWGPAFNETGMREDGFISAWCEGIARNANASAVKEECYAARMAP